MEKIKYSQGKSWRVLKKPILIMKIWLFLMVVVMQAATAHIANSQQITLSVHDVPLREALREIEKGSNVSFFYNDSFAGLAQKVSFVASDADIADVLAAVLDKTGLSYKLLDKDLFVIAPADVISNLVTITGQVTTKNDRQPFPGVAVAVKGKTVGTITDAEGRYTLDAEPEDILVFSFIGYLTQEIPVGNATRIDVQMEESASTLEEVVVTGMADIDKRMFTGATDQLKATDIQLGGTPDISRSLEGRSAGVTVQNVSGTFGTAPKIRVRGATSIYGNSKPLWVVDGIIMQDVVDISADDLSSGDISTLVSSSIAGLNANDIEDITILKDGSATSLYGAKAMAGVIVVTTKRGRAGSASITYTGQMTTRLIPSYANFNIMNSQEQMGVYQELEQKGWLNYSDVSNARNSGVYGKMYELINTVDPVTGQFGLLNAEATRNAYLREAERRNTDWFQELFSSAPQQNHALSMSGGTDKSTYYVSVSAILDPGWTMASQLKRYTGSFTLDHQINDKLSVNLHAKVYTRNQEAPGTMNRQIDNVYGEVFRNFDINPYYYALNTSRTLDPNTFYRRDYAPFNIKHELRNNYMELNESSTLFKGEIDWSPINGLTLKAMGNIKYVGSTMEQNIHDNANQALAYRAMQTSIIANANPYVWEDPTLAYDLPISVLPQGGIYGRTDNRLSGFDFRGSANYFTDFQGSDHQLAAYAGTEFNSVDRYNTWFRGWGRQYDMGNKPFVIYQAFQNWQSKGEDYYSITNTRRRDAAFFGQASYTYREKYTLNLTGRYEGSNQMGKSRQSRWLPTWNIGGLWNLGNETFFDGLESMFRLSHASIRASYSLTAAAPPTSVSTAVIYSSENTWRTDPDTNEPALVITDIGNQSLTYEKKREFNIGGDFGFVGNRINLSVDVWDRHNYDLIGYVAAMGMGGQIDKRGNVATMDSKGVDATLSTQNMKRGDFSWSSNVTFAKFKTIVTDLDTRSRVIDLITGTGFAREGYSHRTLFSIPFAGLDENGMPLVYDHTGEAVRYIYFQDREFLDFLIPAGPVEPTLTGGFGNTLKYRNFSLNVFVTYSFGNKLRLAPVFADNYSDLTAMPKEFKNRWILPGDEAYTNIPVIVTERQKSTNTNQTRYAYAAYNYSSARVADGGFVRMKQITLGYDVPSHVITPAGLKSLTLKAEATNLFLLYADKKLNGQDPEFYNSGGVASPVPRQITFTVSLGL
jgi:TonB-linked SusC/RagA family outer membrane protein